MIWMKIGWKWINMDKSGWKWMKLDENGQKWMKVDANGWKWMKWMKVDENRYKWIKWMKVGEKLDFSLIFIHFHPFHPLSNIVIHFHWMKVDEMDESGLKSVRNSNGNEHEYDFVLANKRFLGLRSSQFGKKTDCNVADWCTLQLVLIRDRPLLISERGTALTFFGLGSRAITCIIAPGILAKTSVASINLSNLSVTSKYTEIYQALNWICNILRLTFCKLSYAQWVLLTSTDVLVENIHWIKFVTF